jgi:hypothetical protein
MNQKLTLRALMTGAFIFAVSMPAMAVDTNVSSSGASASGAINDGLFYSIGGGTVISPPASRNRMARIGLDGGWSSDLMCGNFDLKTTVGNQLNGVTSGFKDLMGNVMQGATGAVMSMPAMAIQRANPGLYEMLTNGVLQAGLSFDKALLNCQNMSKKWLITLWAASGSRLPSTKSTRTLCLPVAEMRFPVIRNCRKQRVKKALPGSAGKNVVVKASRPYSPLVIWQKPATT